MQRIIQELVEKGALNLTLSLTCLLGRPGWSPLLEPASPDSDEAREMGVDVTGFASSSSS